MSLLVAVAATVWSCLAAADPGAAAPRWHTDLPGARGASEASRRPVLAIFVASWNASSRRIAADVQADTEAAALIAAAFEAVVVDIDTEPALTRRLGVVHVPTAVVLGAGDAPLATFECPDAIGPFVTAAERAAREAAAHVAAEGIPRRDQAPQRAARGSISLLTAKVRHLSTFAGETTVADAPTVAQPADLHGAFAAGPPMPAGEPVLPQTPPKWDAERATTPLAMDSVARSPRPAIEPLPQGAVTDRTSSASTGPWLKAAAPPAAESVASVSDLPSEAIATDRGPRRQSGDFWGSLRNPFQAGKSGGKEALAAAPPATTPEPPPTLPPARPLWPGLATAIPARPAVDPPPTETAEPPMPLGLEGYCPVTLADKQVWAEGRAQYGVRHRGRTYLFAGPEQQRAFLAAPDRYAPALSGDDPVLAFEQGRSMPGQRRYGVVCQSRMYLFSTPQTRDAFAANPDKYTGRVALAEQPSPAGQRTY